MIYYIINSSNFTHYVTGGDFYSVYTDIMKITPEDHELSVSVANWCELALVGERYEHDLFSIEIAVM